MTEAGMGSLAICRDYAKDARVGRKPGRSSPGCQMPAIRPWTRQREKYPQFVDSDD